MTPQSKDKTAEGGHPTSGYPTSGYPTSGHPTSFHSTINQPALCIAVDPHPLTAPPGFRGLDPDKPIRVYTRHLPHWRQDGATYFVTFRLGDSLPEARLIEIKNLRNAWEHEHPEPRSEKDWEDHAREITRRTEAWLDEGHGACYFRETRWAEDLRDRLHHFHEQRYQLGCWVIMPNHCHVVIRPFDGHELEDLIGGMKSVTSRHILAEFRGGIRRRPGAAIAQAAIPQAMIPHGANSHVWQDESYDRIVRDLSHLHRVIQYIGRNPAQSKVPKADWWRWINPSWQQAGWDFKE